MTSGTYYVISDFHHSELRDETKISENIITQITARLWISNHENSLEPKVLLERKIRATLHIGDKPKTVGQLQKYRDLGITHKTIILEDKLREKISDHFIPIWDFFTSNASINVLIHCSTGCCRAPAAVLYYMVRKAHSCSEKPIKPVADKLYKQLVGLRPCVEINLDFLNQIRAYEAGIMGLEFAPEKLFGRDFLKASGGDDDIRRDIREVKEVIVTAKKEE